MRCEATPLYNSFVGKFWLIANHPGFCKKSGFAARPPLVMRLKWKMRYLLIIVCITWNRTISIFPFQSILLWHLKTFSLSSFEMDCRCLILTGRLTGGFEGPGLQSGQAPVAVWVVDQQHKHTSQQVCHEYQDEERNAKADCSSKGL
jgi:hypothetical protein